MLRSLLLALLLLPACASSRTRPDASGLFSYHLHQIFVPVSVNNTPVGLALLDTGAGLHAIDDDIAARLALGPGTLSTVEGTAGTIQTRTVSLDSVSVFTASAASAADATVYDLSHIATPDGQPLALILGYPFLRHFAVAIDYPARRLSLHPRPIRAPRSVPMRLDHGIPTVEILLNDQPFPARIDTGASLFDSPDPYLNITIHTASSLASRGQDLTPAQTLSATGIGGPITLEVIRLNSATLAGREIPRPWAIIQPEVGVFADASMPGFVANYTLEPLGFVVLDYLDNTLDLP